jgi:formylglycine-generating enzyme required for sulfatase activity
MVQIQGGTFQMGSPEEEPGRDPDETQHEVTLTSFYMGKYPVTQEQYEAVTGKTIVEQQALATYPSTTDYGRGDNFPMYYVSWYDALVFCNKLSMQEGLSPAYRINGSTNPAAWGSVPTNSNATWNAVQIVSSSNGYRLPTEAQWEYACRAGTYTPFNTGNNITTDQANYSGDNPYNGNPGGIYLGRTTEVGSFAPNDWNLYDMHGNVWEWCWDWYDTYASDAQTDPTGAVSGTLRMARGGAWDTIGSSLRSAYRFSPNSGPGYVGSIMGFRLVRPIASSGGNQTLIEMIQIQGGNFTMGSPESETGSTSIERPQHLVMLSGFSMGKYPVTQAQYQAVMGTNPSDFTTAVSPETSTANRPVENVSWDDAIVFCNKLSMRESLSPAYSISGSTDPAVWGTVPTTSNTTWNAVIIVAGSNGYRLPTEAQWEYACRAGTTTAYNTGDTISDNTGWYSGNSGERTHTVGEKSVNAYGLYDMHGNVWEWCWDWYAAYVSETQTDPIGPETGPMRVKRGGAWYYSAPILRSASRTINNPQYVDNYNGFRLVRPAQ